jgi:UDP-glucose 4-epimerase
MKILLTGSTGFIGKNILQKLRNKYRISAPACAELDLLEEDAVAAYFKKNHFDLVIHTATWDATRNSKKELREVLPNNLRMFFNLARNQDRYAKMIYYGSGAEFDRSHWVPKMEEGYFDTYVPSDDYGFSKYLMNKYVQCCENIYNLRLFGVFGKYEDWEIRFISNACCKAVYGLPITIKQDLFFDYLYIDDLVTITEWFVRHSPREKVFNLCTGRAYSLLALAKKVLAASGKDLEIKVSRKGLGKEYSGDNSRLIKKIGNYQFRDLDQSIQELYAWYRQRKKTIDKRKLLADK